MIRSFYPHLLKKRADSAKQIDVQRTINLKKETNQSRCFLKVVTERKVHYHKKVYYNTIGYLWYVHTMYVNTSTSGLVYALKIKFPFIFIYRSAGIIFPTATNFISTKACTSRYVSCRCFVFLSSEFIV